MLKLKIFLIILVSVFIFSCSKEVKKPAEEKTAAESKPVENKIEEQKSEPPAPEKTAEQLEAEEKYKKSKAYEEKLKQLRDKVGIKPDFMYIYDPYMVKDIDLINNKLIIPASYENVQHIDVENIEYDGQAYKCIQKIKIANNFFLEYQMTLQYNQHAGIYAITENKLITPINIGNINEKTIKNQVDGKIIFLKDDINNIELIKVFEEYENENYPMLIFNNRKKLKVLDYIKGNFTNSKHDEYIVFFCDGKTTKDYISRLHCFIVENNKIINEYPIMLYDEDYLDNEKMFIVNLENDPKYVFTSSTGFVADFNQNGKNELYFKTVFVGGTDFYRAEFEDDFFNINLICLHNYSFKKLNWHTKTITMRIHEDYIYSQTNTGSYSSGYAEYQWNEDLNDFILKHKKITEKYGWEKSKE